MKGISDTIRNELVIGIDPIIQDAVISLKERVDFALIALLIVSESLSFSEILAEFKMNPTELDRTLDRLMNAALVDNFYAKKAGSKKHSFYEATTLAKTLFQELRELQEVKRQRLPWNNRFYRPGSEISPVGLDFREPSEWCTLYNTLIDRWTDSLNRRFSRRKNVEIIE
jgi:DNA-binding HxlR family transcriptional regulator